MSNQVLRLNSLTKEFPGVKALNNVSFFLQEGEVLALLGENGAGKSTLIKCLTGSNVPTSGTIEVFGKEYSNLPPALSRQLGISAVYQEFNLVPELPIVENVFMGNNPGKGIIVDYKQMLDRCNEMFRSFNLNINPKANVSTLSPAMMQIVEISKAIALNGKILILDEPTAPLTQKETEILFDIVRDLKEKGVSIIYISHRLEEVFEICSRAIILRDGEKVDEMMLKDVTRMDLIRSMIGRELTNYYPERKTKPSEEVVMQVKELKGNGNQAMSFDVHKGEILGFAGLVGAGRTELMNVLFADVKKESGQIFVNSKEMKASSPKNAIDNGISYLPEDRKARGLIQTHSILFNITLASIKKYSRWGVVNDKKENDAVSEYCRILDIKTPSFKKEVQYLSGGNQQKVVISKWLSADGEIIIFDEPTRGIDVGAKHEIYEIMISLVDQGKTIIMVSSEFEELIGIADRILVMSEGRLAGEFEKKDFNKEAMLDVASGNR